MEKLPIEEALKFIESANILLECEPFIEKRYCEVSKRYSWLMRSSAKAVESLIKARHPSSLSQSSLSILAKIPPFKELDYSENLSTISEIAAVTKDWQDLNFALFWKSVEMTRNNVFSKKGERLTHYWQAYILESLWSFKADDFECIKKEITNKEFLDDKLVALTLAFHIYKENGRPRKWREV